MSAAGTAIQIQRVGPRRGAIVMSVVLAATLGIGFFAGRITESVPSKAPVAISQIAPDVAWATDGAIVKGTVYEKTLGGSAVGTGGPAIGGLAPHVPKRADATEATSDRVGSNHYLPKQWHM
jgi:hypothetical protein